MELTQLWNSAQILFLDTHVQCSKYHLEFASVDDTDDHSCLERRPNEIVSSEVFLITHLIVSRRKSQTVRCFFIDYFNLKLYYAGSLVI